LALGTSRHVVTKMEEEISDSRFPPDYN
jgi:hypothetical protein